MKPEFREEPVFIRGQVYRLRFVRVGNGWWPTNLHQPGLGRVNRVRALRAALARIKGELK